MYLSVRNALVIRRRGGWEAVPSCILGSSFEHFAPPVGVKGNQVERHLTEAAAREWLDALRPPEATSKYDAWHTGGKVRPEVRKPFTKSIRAPYPRKDCINTRETVHSDSVI